MELSLEVKDFNLNTLEKLFQWLTVTETIWVILSVDEGGTLALTQQLTHFNALGSVTPHSPPQNPFANATLQNAAGRPHSIQVRSHFSETCTRY
jgi:hypothetical protein